MTRSLFLTIASQASLAITLCICVLIRPSVLISLPQGGLSNYGTESQTIVVFSVGFWVATVFLLIAAKKSQDIRLKKTMSFFAVLLALLIISTYPYRINTFFENIHILIGFTVGTFQLISAYLLARWVHFDNVSRIAGLFLLGSIITGISTIFSTGLLFTSQLLGGLGYGTLLVHYANFKETKGESNV